MNIRTLAKNLNSLSVRHNVGNLQSIRKQLHGLSKINFNSIFSPKTVFDNRNIYAYHHGGRSEIQFNIGWEMESGLFRYGLAFSLEKSQSLKDPVNTLGPKIQRFNEYVQIKPDKCSDYEMWDYQNGKRSNNRQPGPIKKDLIKNGTFIFIGKFFTKKMEDIEEADLHEILKTFDRLLEIYEYIEGNEVIEDKIARICWNSYGWQRPSGREGKSKNKTSYEYMVGYGHEEWLLDIEKVTEGYHYGYLQPIGKAWSKYQGKRFNISLYSINNYTGERWWIGTINNAHIVSPDESKKVLNYYKKKGWLKEMVEQIRNVDGREKDFIDSSFSDFVNLKFRPYDWQLLDPPQRISNKDKAISSTYYVLLNKNRDPNLEIPLGNDPHFKAGHTSRKEKSIAYYGQRKSEIDYFHNKMQDNVYKQLVKIYGVRNVRTERPIGLGVPVDLSAKEGNSEIFYEFKTSNSIRACIREALAQLLEYSYYPDKNRAKKLIIVSQNPINKQAKEYLSKLRKQFDIPVYYKQYDTEKNCLEEAEY